MGTMKNTKAAKATKPETIKSLQDLTAPVKPENPTSPVPPADQPEEAAQPAAPEQSATRQMTEEEFIEFMSKVTGRPDLVKAIMNAAKNPESVSEQKKEQHDVDTQVSQEDLKKVFALLTAGKAEKVHAEVVEDDDDDEEDDDDDEFEDDYIWNPDPAWETAGWVLGGAALVGFGVLIGYLVTK